MKPPMSSNTADPFTSLDVLQPCAALLHRLRHRLHFQVSPHQGGGLRHALRRQVPQELREARREVPGAERCDGTVWYSPWQVKKEIPRRDKQERKDQRHDQG